MSRLEGTSMNDDRARRDYFIGQALAGLCARYGVERDARVLAEAAVVVGVETIRALDEIKALPPVPFK